ncbi:nucleoporin subcomplex protein binding to Pom34-domain-containing protein [Collybia nuda]|uniref:Nucleoporin NUP188 n=1 Tax=Collybia nuda TaxID=64659 RepID=A0A9P5XWR1_9AGAR|nr:nucleoporin subcomplex protein binding to Pom34-domain-containing protein [Collybia nuda]
MMSGESSKRSSLCDVTYLQLHSILSGHLEGVREENLIEYLNPRKPQLISINNPFGEPSDASKKKIESGSLVLEDGVTFRVDETDKEFTFAISTKFQIDQVQSFILLRSFLYNEGLPSHVEPLSTEFLVPELLEAIAPFYYSERLSVLRTLIPLFRAKENAADPIHQAATEFLPQLIPDEQSFAESLIIAYVGKTKQELPGALSGDPKAASRWAKQINKEQLVLLEVLFWTMWGFAPCSGQLVEKIFEAAYGTRLGSQQANATLLLDDEGTQLQEDCAALWVLITIEVLELETIGEPGALEISDDPHGQDFYATSPQSMERIHQIVLSHVDSQNACTYLAWAFVLSRFASKVGELKEIPTSYRPFFETILPHLNRAYSKDYEPTHVLMSKACLNLEVGLFNLLETFLTQSPLFVTAAAWRKGSSVTDPNAVAFRSVIKGLLISLVELVPVEMIPDFDAFVNVWIALFGRSESQSIVGICAQYWQSDWQNGLARRAIFDVARSRFPIHIKPLIRLLRAMTATGFLDTDPLSTADHSNEGLGLSDAHDLCDRHVFYYFNQLSTFSQVIPISACSGPHALYEKQQERVGTNGTSTLNYVNLRPLKLPGGSILPARTVGRLLSGDGNDFVIVSWQHEHSGWKFILELLTDYVNRRRMHSGSGGGYQDVSFGRRDVPQMKSLRIDEIGTEMVNEGDETVITDALDLVRSLIQDNPAQAEQLMLALEAGDPVVAHTMTEAQPPDLVQLTTMILEEALTQVHARARTQPRTNLITSTMSVLSALLALPHYSSRVWLYIRSTKALFGTDRSAGFASVALASERSTGHYTMTLALLHLVQRLFHEAASSVLPDNPRLQQLKEEVLLRAARFVHTEIWVEHLSWKFAQLGDRFEIGRRVTALYVEVLQHAPPTLDQRPFATLSQSVADVLLFKATSSTINPLVSSITSGDMMIRMLYAARRVGDARRLIFLLESHLLLTRLVLNYKQKSTIASRPSLLEQALCARVIGSASSTNISNQPKLDPIDVLALYVKGREVGTTVPVEAMRVLRALCASLSLSPSPPTIIGHLANPEATVASFVQIIQHPYDDLTLRNAVWDFISLAIDREPALAGLFVTGQFKTPGDIKGKGKEVSTPEKSKPTSAIDVAKEILSNWKGMWEPNPELLSAVLRFLDVVWQHALEHKLVLRAIHEDSDFWDHIVSIACEEVGPAPVYEPISYENKDGTRHSTLHYAIATYAYRTTAKAYAVHIIGLDIGIHIQLHGREPPTRKPLSFLKMEPHFKSQDQLTDLVCDAAPSSYDPQIHDRLVEQLKDQFLGLTLEQVQLQEPVEQREFGDDFVFSTSLLRNRLQAYTQKADAMVDSTDIMEAQLCSVNLNLSLAHCQMSLAESWQFLFQQVAPYLRGDAAVRPVILSIAASISYDIAAEGRSGDMMATIHGTRLSLLLAMLEVAWFSTSDKPAEIQSFIDLVRNVHGIITNESQSPARSFLGALSVPFHRTLLQIVYFCTRHARNLALRPKLLQAEQRLTITSTVDVALSLVIDALRVVFTSARSRVDPDLDRDMELLVAVFERCIYREINPSSTQWLARCQEMDIIRRSLDLYVHSDLVGLSDLPLLLSRKQPLYAPHILLFHMALVSNPSAAERFASDGVLSAYSNNFISAAISAGLIDVTLPELPGERSPAHRAYCSMLAIVSGVITALGRQNHYFDAEASGFVQLYGDQISRALSWTIGDSLTSPGLEEMEQVVNLFYSIAASAPSAANSNPAVDKVLRVFTTHALQLIQQLNYAITHPNHLASLFEPVTTDERAQLDKDPPSVEPLKRPLIAQVVHRLYRLSSNIVATLVAISRAESVLVGGQEDWPVNEALIVPHSKVVLGEPASMGTLLELGNCTLDMLRDLVNRPAGQSLTNAPGSNLDVRQGVLTARRNLEGVLVYAVTQLVMWLSKPEFDVASPEPDADESQSMDVQRMDTSKERRPPRPSMSLAERLRRGMTGEMAADLQSLLNKSKPIIAKSDTVLEKGGVDLTPILSNFLQERIASPA